jgi:hypothetical protein
MQINCSFSGGLELLFDNLKQVTIQTESASISDLFVTLSEKITANKDLFIKDGEL